MNKIDLIKIKEFMFERSFENKVNEKKELFMDEKSLLWVCSENSYSNKKVFNKNNWFTGEYRKLEKKELDEIINVIINVLGKNVLQEIIDKIRDSSDEEIIGFELKELEITHPLFLLHLIHLCFDKINVVEDENKRKELRKKDQEWLSLI